MTTQSALRRQTHDDGSVSLHALVGTVVEVTTGDDEDFMLYCIEVRAGELEARAGALRGLHAKLTSSRAAKAAKVQP